LECRARGAIDRHNASTANHDCHVGSNHGSNNINNGDVVEYDRGLASGALAVKQNGQAKTQQ
jgi:hypothetical protein